MALKPNPPLLVGVDANVALDFADGNDSVIDSITTIRARIGEGALCVLPTRPFDVTPPVIATPREIVRKFFR